MLPRDVPQEAIDDIAEALEDRSHQVAGPKQKAKSRRVLGKVAKTSFAILGQITKLRDEGKSPKEALDSVKILTFPEIYATYASTMLDFLCLASYRLQNN